MAVDARKPTIYGPIPRIDCHINDPVRDVLLSYLVARRGLLGSALAQLHAEYDAQHPLG